jgi:hypothetical protein
MASLHQHQMSKLSLSMKMMGRQSPIYKCILTTSFIVFDISIGNALCLFEGVGNMITEVGDANIVHAYVAIDMAMYQFPP